MSAEHYEKIGMKLQQNTNLSYSFLLILHIKTEKKEF